MPGRIRKTRRLCSWMIEQVNSERFPGLVWDDEAKTMFRIPWKHAGKQDFRSDEDAAIFKAWAEFKGKLTDGGRADPASWKTRLRCALNKSPEFEEVTDRSQLDISEPYKVYRLVPMNEQGLTCTNIKSRARSTRRRRKSSESDSEEDSPEAKHMKGETSPITMSMDFEALAEVTVQSEELVPPVVAVKNEAVDEIQLNFMIETAPVCGVEPSFQVSVRYFGREVLQRGITGHDVRIAFSSSSPTLPTPPALMLGGFPRILLPEPSPLLATGPEEGGRLQALSTLLPFMEKGVVLTSSVSGIYGRRFCQGRVYWTGPHTSAPGPLKMERAMEPVLLFSKDIFRQELDKFRLGGPRPQCGITLCFGEEFLSGEDPSSKLIISQITFPWAERLVQDVVQDACVFKDPMAFFHNLATQSPSGEVTLNLMSVPLNDQ